MLLCACVSQCSVVAVVQSVLCVREACVVRVLVCVRFIAFVTACVKPLCVTVVFNSYGRRLCSYLCLFAIIVL